MDLKQFTVMASGKMRQCAYDALKDKVNLLSWQQGGRMPQEQFDAWLSQADAIFSISNFKANEELLAKAPKLKVIAQSAVGYDNIDVAACNAHGVRVGNTPGVLVDDVADLAYALLVDSARRIVKAHAHVASGLWGQRKPFGVTTALAGKTLGIIGESGCGKSTLVRTLLQIQPATSGEAIFEGHDLLKERGEESRQDRRKIQMVFHKMGF